MRLAAQAKGGFYPTPARVVDLIAPLIFNLSGTYRNDNAEVLRILDPCCGAGEAARQLADQLRSRSSIAIESFGIELQRARAVEAQSQLDHLLAADIYRCSIANRAFGLLWLNPPYDHDGEQRRVEHAFLMHCSRYLTPGGLLVFIVPRKQLAVSAGYLASHYRRLSCWAFPEPEREAFDQVVVLGERKSEPAPDRYGERELARWAAGELEPLDGDLQPLYDAPPTAAGEILFTTRTIDPEAAAAEARSSGLWRAAAVTDALWPQADLHARPLMPLRRGHLAMLVAAGFLDNLELEANGSHILVKGRTWKSFVLVDETPEREVFQERLRTTVVALDLKSGAISEIDA